MALLKLSLAALVGTAVGALAAVPQGTPPAATPATTAVVVQSPVACAPRLAAATGDARVTGVTAAPSRAALRAAVPAPAHRLAGAGADVHLVCDAADATAAVVRAAGTHAAVLGTGPDVRAALTLAAADHPGTRFGGLPSR